MAQSQQMCHNMVIVSYRNHSTHEDNMNISTTSLPGVILIEPRLFSDNRGFFLETFNQNRFDQAGLNLNFVQDNHSRSCRGTLRGLHYQLKHPQGKLVYAVRGEILDVAVDIRRGSATFGRWVSVLLSEENHKQLYVPEGFAHGFCVLSETADVIYKCTDVYTPGDDYGLLWEDEALAIDWSISAPLLSDKDRQNPRLSEMPPENLPLYSAS